MIGSYQAKKDIPVRCGVTAFTLPERSIVAVTQVDAERRKVLVEFGPVQVDWKHERFLENFEPLN